jgi:hypothetical protein
VVSSRQPGLMRPGLMCADGKAQARRPASCERASLSMVGLYRRDGTNSPMAQLAGTGEKTAKCNP